MLRGSGDFVGRQRGRVPNVLPCQMPPCPEACLSTCERLKGCDVYCSSRWDYTADGKTVQIYDHYYTTESLSSWWQTKNWLWKSEVLMVDGDFEWKETYAALDSYDKTQQQEEEPQLQEQAPLSARQEEEPQQQQEQAPHSARKRRSKAYFKRVDSARRERRRKRRARDV